MKNIKQLKQFLRNIDYWFQIAICIIILFSVVFSSFRTAYDSHVSFFKKKPNETLLKTLDKIGSNHEYNLFLNYTGLNTGYGFFSPNVSSDFIITHTIYKNQKEDLTFSNTLFSTKEGAHRFANLNSLFMEKIEAIEEEDKSKIDTLKIKYLEVVLNRLNNYNLEQDKDIDSIKTTLFLYHFPFLKEYPNVNPKFIKIESHSKIKK
ncbi:MULTISPECIES: hypothetical protein [Flavobacterium]|jgi:hypothetical protein|uniref:DUF4230 domain-containing protein n=1 Tax=Flavobacterium jumunjinense TaxID=998845 RepID=A0ABV5GQB8_9FLAO|nr:MULTISPECIES: hypothetical protein [Flavobacterium]